MSEWSSPSVEEILKENQMISFYHFYKYVACIKPGEWSVIFECLGYRLYLHATIFQLGFWNCSDIYGIVSSKNTETISMTIKEQHSAST
jgi:hypothetical protein